MSPKQRILNYLSNLKEGASHLGLSLMANNLHLPENIVVAKVNELIESGQIFRKNLYHKTANKIDFKEYRYVVV